MTIYQGNRYRSITSMERHWWSSTVRTGSACSEQLGKQRGSMCFLVKFTVLEKSSVMGVMHHLSLSDWAPCGTDYVWICLSLLSVLDKKRIYIFLKSPKKPDTWTANRLHKQQWSLIRILSVFCTIQWVFKHWFSWNQDQAPRFYINF